MSVIPDADLKKLYEDNQVSLGNFSDLLNILLNNNKIDKWMTIKKYYSYMDVFLNVEQHLWYSTGIRITLLWHFPEVMTLLEINILHSYLYWEINSAEYGYKPHYSCFEAIKNIKNSQDRLSIVKNIIDFVQNIQHPSEQYSKIRSIIIFKLRSSNC